MTKILWLIALALLPWLATRLDAPKWAVLLTLVPFGLLAMSMGDSDEEMFGDASPKVGRFLFLGLGMGMGMGSVALGLVAFSLRGSASMLGLIWWVLPIAVVLLVIGVIRLFRQ